MLFTRKRNVLKKNITKPDAWAFSHCIQAFLMYGSGLKLILIQSNRINTFLVHNLNFFGWCCSLIIVIPVTGSVWLTEWTPFSVKRGRPYGCGLMYTAYRMRENQNENSRGKKIIKRMEMTWLYYTMLSSSINILASIFSVLIPHHCKRICLVRIYL